MKQENNEKSQETDQYSNIPFELYRFPTNLQMEIFYMLRQTKGSQYEISRKNIGNVAMSNVAKCQEITVSEDQLQVLGSQGYRTCIGTHGVSCGTWYYECSYDWPERGTPQFASCIGRHLPQVRVGFQTLKHVVNGPVGFERCGVALRSVDCAICTDRHRLFTDDFYQTESFKSFQISTGQVIGCLIHIPEDYETETVLKEEAEICVEKIYERRNTQNKYDFDEDTPSNDQLLRGSAFGGEVAIRIGEGSSSDSHDTPQEVVPGSYIEFYVDGILVARKNNIIYDRWYPAVSCYQYARVQVNFGIRNIRIPGYPIDFYCLKGCLVNPLNGDIDQVVAEGFGRQKLDIQKIIKQDDSRIKAEGENQSIEQNYNQQNSNQQTHSNFNNKLQNSENGALDTNLKNNRESIIRKYLKATCNQFDRTAGYIKKKIQELYDHIQNGEQTDININDIKQQISNVENKGFKYLPRPDANPFTLLYIPRTETDYKLTRKYINEGIYNKFIHEWISSLVDDSSKKTKR